MQTTNILFRDSRIDHDRSLDTKARTIDLIASTTDEDDHGTVIESDWRLDRFRKNPVILYSHNQPVGGFFGGGGGAGVTDTIPIARAENIRVEGGKLKMRAVFPPEGEDERSDEVWKALCSKRLNSVSVGFRPGKVTREDLGDGRCRYRLSECELYEASIVPIGSNPNAVAERNLKALDRWTKEQPMNPNAALNARADEIQAAHFARRGKPMPRAEALEQARRAITNPTPRFTSFDDPNEGQYVPNPNAALNARADEIAKSRGLSRSAALHAARDEMVRG